MIVVACPEQRTNAFFFRSQPGHETEDKVLYGDGKAESVEETQAPLEAKPETPAVAPVSDTKEAEKVEEKIEEPVKTAEPAQVEEPIKAEDPLKVEQPAKIEEPVKAEAPQVAETPVAAVVQEPSVQDVVDKTQDSKAGKVGALETAEDEGKGKARFSMGQSHPTNKPSHAPRQCRERDCSRRGSLSLHHRILRRGVCHLNRRRDRSRSPDRHAGRAPEDVGTDCRAR